MPNGGNLGSSFDKEPHAIRFSAGRPAAGRLTRGVGLAELFTGFLSLGLMSFGGALPFARRTIVEERKWLSADEFTDLLGLCQFLPGGNVINLSVAVGMRFRGVAGAFAGILGLIAGPTLVVVALGVLYAKTQNDPRVQHLFAGRRGGGRAARRDGREGLEAAAACACGSRHRGARVRRDRGAAHSAADHDARADARQRVVRVAPPRRGHAAAGAGRGARRAARRPAMNDTLIAIATIFSQLSLLAFGGGNTILPEMQRQVVDVHHWMSAHEFTALFALARRARAEHDDRVAGGLARGRLERSVASLAKFGPSSIVTVLALHAWERFRDRPRATCSRG